MSKFFWLLSVGIGVKDQMEMGKELWANSRSVMVIVCSDEGTYINIR